MHKGDKVTKITKRETIEGELGRFVLNKGEEPQAMYNRLKTMVNQVRNLGSTKWNDHKMVKVILRSVVFHNHTQVQLIRESPRYEQMSSEEVIGKFVTFELVAKDSKHIINLEQGGTYTPEPQPVAFKATEEKKEPTPTKRLPIDASKLDNEKMALIIKSFRQVLKQRRGRSTNPAPIGFATGVVSLVIILLNVHMQVIVLETMRRRGRRRWRRRSTTTERRVARCTWEWSGTPTRAPPTPLTRTPPTSPSTRVSSSQMLATSVSWPNRARRRRYTLETPPNILLPMMRVALVKKMMICLLFLQTSPLNKRRKINELIKYLNEKDDVLECQEDLLIKENKKSVKLKDAFTLEVDKCKILTNELKTCNDSISCLNSENMNLIAKIEKLNVCLLLHLLLSMLLFALDVEILMLMLLVITML
jgi:hypothetical protein